MEQEPLDRPGDDGLDTRVGGRGGQRTPGSSHGGCGAPDGQRVVPTTRRRDGCDRRVDNLSEPSSTGVARNSPQCRRSRMLPAARLASGGHRNSEKKTARKCAVNSFMQFLERNIPRVPPLSPSARAILAASRATGSASTPRYSQSGPRRTYAPVYQRTPAERSPNGR